MAGLLKLIVAFRLSRKTAVLKIAADAKCIVTTIGGADNDGHENDGPSKCAGMKLTDMKLTDSLISTLIAPTPPIRL